MTISLSSNSYFEKLIPIQFQQLHGGYGFMEEYPIAKTFTNVRVGPIYGGSSEIMREIISRTI